MSLPSKSTLSSFRVLVALVVLCFFFADGGTYSSCAYPSVLVRWWDGIFAGRNIRNDHSLRFPPLPKRNDLPFLFSNATNCSGGHFLPPASGLGGSSDMEVAALEVFFYDPATLDFVLVVLELFLCMLRLVLSPTPTDKMASKPSPSPLASFSEDFFVVLANLGMM
jgi:hypothetical protein